ncbi:MAG: hypothetical protein B7Y12_18620 [Rhizobiales bacterium 24-66-13]|nr:MAG: hypothetical protein B7Y12_18620 [Rhizobiales bacterium 24-66-13]OZB11186.1 MAG: hypothetical protein B7X67_04755 [Rhizobiales bacterium 39-66-18]
MEKPERNHRGSIQERRFLLPLSLLALVMATVALTNASKAEEPSPADEITDGRPWKMTTDDGRVGTLVLFQNGTGKMTGGLMDLSPKWRPTPDGLCLKPGALLPERCVKLVRSGNGYVGLKGGKQAFKLER